VIQRPVAGLGPLENQSANKHVEGISVSLSGPGFKIRTSRLATGG